MTWGALLETAASALLSLKAVFGERHASSITRVLVALGLEGNEQFQDGGVSILTQADSLVHSLSEEASVAFTIGVTQDALGDVLPKGIVEDMVAACLNPKESKAVKFKTEGVETGRLLGVRGRGRPRKPTQAS